MPHGSPRIRLADGRMNLIGARLRQWRRQKHMTQDRLCGAVARVTEGAWIPTRHDIYRIEAGTRTVSDAEAVALAAGLGCGLMWLICGTDVEPSSDVLASQTFRGARPADEAPGKTPEY